MREDDSVRRVDIEWLGFRVGGATGGWVSDCDAFQQRPLLSAHELLTVTNTHPSLKTSDALAVKDVLDHTVRLDLVESSSRSTCHDTGCILTTALSGAAL